MSPVPHGVYSRNEGIVANVSEKNKVLSRAIWSHMMTLIAVAVAVIKTLAYCALQNHGKQHAATASRTVLSFAYQWADGKLELTRVGD